MSKRLRVGIAFLGVAGPIGLAASCSPTAAPAPGALMLAVQTDMHAPKDVDAVGLYVKRGNVTIFGYSEKVAPDGLIRFPATLALEGRNNPGATVHVRAVAFRQNKATVVRDAITAIPTDRVALLRLPLRWIDDNGKAQGTFSSAGSSETTNLALHPLGEGDALIDGFLQITSGCADDQTPLNGGCAPATIDSSSLPTYDESVVFGGGTPSGGGACFDAARCFAGAHRLDLDLTTCSATAPPGVFDLAVMTAPGGSGDCDATGCYVPLDRDTPEGWSIQNGRVVLPGAYCDRITKGDALGIVDDTSVAGCAPKANDAPLCSPASAVGPGSDGGGIGDAGAIGNGDGGLDGSVGDADVNPANITTLATGLDAPTALAVDGNDIYVTVRDGRVYKLAKTSNAGATPFFDPLAPTGGPRADAGPAPEVHVSASGGNVVVAVTQVIPSNGSNVFVLHADGALANQFDAGVPIYDVLATPNEAVWTTNALQYCAWSGCGAPTTVDITTNAVSRPREMAYDSASNALYFRFAGGYSDGRILFDSSEPLGTAATGGRSTTDFARGGIAVDSSNSYLSVAGGSGLPDGGPPPSGNDSIWIFRRGPKTGSTVAYLPVGDLELKANDVSTLPHRLAVDAKGLFWTNAKDEVWSYPTQAVDGGSNQKLVASGQPGARDVAVDGDDIYWTVTNGAVPNGGVVRRASRSALGLP